MMLGDLEFQSIELARVVLNDSVGVLLLELSIYLEL